MEFKLETKILVVRRVGTYRGKIKGQKRVCVFQKRKKKNININRKRVRNFLDKYRKQRGKRGYVYFTIHIYRVM